MSQSSLSVDLAQLEEHVSANAEKLLKCDAVEEVFFVMQTMCFDRVFQNAMACFAADKSIKAGVRQAVRDAFSPCYEKGGILRHSLEKPFGYPGDFQVLEHLYDETIHPLTDPRYKCFDEYIFQVNLIKALRQRKDIIGFLLKQFHSQGMRKFCSIGSGGAREIFDHRDNLTGVELLLIDLDERSFEMAIGRLQGKDITIETSHLDARKLTLAGTHQVIYSFGLFDYLGDRVLDHIIQTSLSQLESGGYLVYSIKDTGFYHPWYYDVLCDWRFVSRDTCAADDVAHRNNLNILQCIPSENGAVRVYVCQPNN